MSDSEFHEDLHWEDNCRMRDAAAASQDQPEHQQTSNYAIHNMCFSLDISEPLFGRVSARQRCSNMYQHVWKVDLTWPLLPFCKYSVQFTKLLVPHSCAIFVTVFILFELLVWSFHALFPYKLLLFTFFLFQFSLKSLCHKGGPTIVQLSSLLHSMHHRQQVVQCVSVTAQANGTLILLRHSYDKTRYLLQEDQDIQR